jgi:type VI secretion system secreted protein VgrG
LPEVLKRQTTLSLKIGGPGGPKPELVRLMADEGLSRPFAISLDVMSKSDIKLLDNLGLPAVIECSIDGQAVRHFHGIVTDGSYIEHMHDGHEMYRLTLSPATWFHEQGSNYRIYQGRQVIDIIKDVLDRCKIDYEVKAKIGKRVLAYCVQYGESDFAFVCRLMEEEGIYYYYRHSATKHQLVLCDSTNCHQELPAGRLRFNQSSQTHALTDSKVRLTGYKATFVQFWQERASSGAEAKVTMRDFDFQKPTKAVETKATEPKAHEQDEIEVYRWPGRYYVEDDGNALTNVLLESRRAQRLRYEGRSHFMGIQAGFTFSLAEHPVGRFNHKYLIIACRTRLTGEHFRSGMESSEGQVEFTAIPDDVPFRAPIVTPRPVPKGPETAVVTGPAGEEIHVDKYGRVKVQFHWDREGKLDDNSSCWIRVSQTGGLGNIITPRIGHEVLIDFINGNPDRPIIVGRVFNEAHMPVYPLPEHKTKALWRTKTYKRDCGVPHDDAASLETGMPGANEIRFEDKTGEEELFLHAEKDMNTRIRYCETHKVGKNADIYIGKNRTEEVCVNETITIGCDRLELVKGCEDVTVVGDRKVAIQSTDSLDVTQSLTIKAGTTIDISAETSITLSVGSSSIVIDQTSIKAMAAVLLDLQGQTNAKLSSPTTTIEGVGLLTATGAMVKIN